LVRVTEEKVQKKVVADGKTKVIVTKGGDGVVDCAQVTDKKSCGISVGVGDGVSVILDLECDGKNCTQYGVWSKWCLADIFPVTKHRMQKLSASNPLMNGRLFEYMINKENRFVLYS